MATNNQVAHAWANQTGKQRKGFSMFYDGPSLFSWGRHWEMARLVDLPNGTRAAMLYEPSRGRSVTTSKHFGYARRACDHLPSYLVQSFDDHARNYGWYLKEAEKAVGRASRAIKYGPMYLRNADDMLEDAYRYSTAFQLGHEPVKVADLPGYTEKMRAKLEAQRAQTEARRRKETRDSRDSYKENLRAWLAGDDCYVPHNGRPWCRVKGDTVETSWGATVPLQDAIKLFRIATKKRAAGEAWQPCGLWAHKVGDFALRSITRTGDLIVGCHHIPYRAAKLAADKAGIAI